MSVEGDHKDKMCSQPAEKKCEVGDVEDWFPAPLVNQLPKGERVDDGAHVRRRDHPWTADFLEGKPMRWMRTSILGVRGGAYLHLSRATGVVLTESRCNSGGSC